MALPVVGQRDRRRRVRPLVVILVAGAVAGASITVAMARATAAPIVNPVITVFSEPNLGTKTEFDQANATITGARNLTNIHLVAKGGTLANTWSFIIKPPPGTKLSVGYYGKVQSAQLTTQSAGYVAMNIFGPGNRCADELTGGIDIRDLAVSGSTITKLDLLYEERCTQSGPATFGEIRIGEPRTAGLIVSSGSILWPHEPGVPSGSFGTAVPVYVRNPSTSPVQVGSASLSGQGSSAFTIAANSCTGVSLRPGSSCMFIVRMGTVTTRGPRTAMLRLPVGTGSASIQLDALVRPGTSGLTMQSQPGDFIGLGTNYDFSQANSSSVIYGGANGSADDSHGLEEDFQMLAVPRPSWTVDMFPANGADFAVRTYPNAVIYRSNGARNQLEISGDARACDAIQGSFTVKQAAFSATNGYVQHFDATFIQYCDGSTAALTGELKYDAEPVTTAEPVSGLTATANGSGVAISWVKPASSRYRYALVRVEPSGTPAGIAAFAGRNVYGGTGTSTVAHGLLSGHTYQIAVYAVDQYGNISPPVTRNITV